MGKKSLSTDVSNNNMCPIILVVMVLEKESGKDRIGE